MFDPSPIRLPIIIYDGHRLIDWLYYSVSDFLYSPSTIFFVSHSVSVDSCMLCTMSRQDDTTVIRPIDYWTDDNRDQVHENWGVYGACDTSLLRVNASWIYSMDKDCRSRRWHACWGVVSARSNYHTHRIRDSCVACGHIWWQNEIRNNLKMYTCVSRNRNL